MHQNFFWYKQAECNMVPTNLCLHTHMRPATWKVVSSVKMVEWSFWVFFLLRITMSHLLIFWFWNIKATEKSTFCKLTREVAPCFLELTFNCFYFPEMCWLLLWMMKAMTKQAGADVMSALIKHGVQSPTYILALCAELSWFYWTSRVLLHLSYFLHPGWTSLQTLQTGGVQLHKAEQEHSKYGNGQIKIRTAQLPQSQLLEWNSRGLNIKPLLFLVSGLSCSSQVPQHFIRGLWSKPCRRSEAE